MANSRDNEQTGKQENYSRFSDLKDSPRDEERLKAEETTIDLPDVEDIPGQENITVPPLGALADTTISSDDEEGKGIFDEETDATENVSYSEKELLRASAHSRGTIDESRMSGAALDATDSEGEPVNEGGSGKDKTGRDLDIPGSEADDANENIGEEDEENNYYSLGGEG